MNPLLVNKIKISIIFLLFNCVAFGQDTIVFNKATKGPCFNILPSNDSTNVTYSASTDFVLSFPEIDINKPTYSLFISDAELQEIHVQDQIFYTGKYQNRYLLSNRWDYRHFTIPSKLLLNETITYQSRNITKQDFTIAPTLIEDGELDIQMVKIIAQSKTGIIFIIFFLGAITIFLIYTIGLTIQTRNPDFRFYSYYLGAILLHNFIQADAFLKIYTLFPSNPIWYHNLNEFLQMFIYVFFVLFIKVFLDLKNQKPRLAKFVDRSIVSFIIFAFIFLGTAMFTKDFLFLQNYLSILWIVVAAAGTIIVGGVTRNSSNPVRYYILVGSIFLLFGSFLELYTSLNIVGGYNWNMYAIPENQWYSFNYTQAAILLETICFALGIGYKIRIQDQERVRNVDLGQKLVEEELSTLRSQMNPHFLFNSLNSVNNFIMKEKPQIASKYLTRFSQLMRTILNNSKQKFVSLNQEIELIRLYVELENLRFSERFDFKINTQDGLASDQILIPSMLIQPYIENAIKHGLIPLGKLGKLLLNITESEGILTIEIDDNGIGRSASLRTKNELDKARKSHGMEITYHRIDLLNKIYDLNATIDIQDKAQGTLVKLTMKLITDEAQAISNHR